MAVWQIAAGDGPRDYADVFLEYGVVLVGPGEPGPYPENRDIYRDGAGDYGRDFLIRFAEELEDGDKIVLKRPYGRQWEVIAVGQVVGEYEYHDVFGDVDGWDLQHCRRVAWRLPPSQTVIEGLVRGTLKRVNNEKTVSNLEQIWEEGIERPASPIPEEKDPVNVDQVTDALMLDGLPSKTAEEISKTIWRLRRLAKWYSAHGENVGEHEIRTFLISPLLTSLGWSEQRIKIEWSNIDIALFSKPYSSSGEPEIIIESKRLNDGLRYAPKQATDYAERYKSCETFIVSDGIRYKLFSRYENEWHYSSYVNLLEPRMAHPYISNVGGAVDFFRKLIPGIIHKS